MAGEIAKTQLNVNLVPAAMRMIRNAFQTFQTSVILMNPHKNVLLVETREYVEMV